MATKSKAAGARPAGRKPARQEREAGAAGTRQPGAENASDSRSEAAAEERRRRIAEAAYYRAEQRGFATGFEYADWLDAEKELDRRDEGISSDKEISMDAENLNKCLRSELSAIETYNQALEKHRKKHASDAGFQQLSRMLDDHRDAASKLRALIQQGGGKPSNDSGAWGTWSKTVMGAAKLLGDKAALKALKEGEESGLKEYREVAQDSAASAEVKSTVAPLMTRQQEHIRQLDALIEAA